MSKIYDEIRSAEQSQSRGSSHIAPGLRIKGEVTGSEDLVADGSIEGPVTLTGGILTVGEKGVVTGNVVAKEVVVHGSITGNVDARDRVAIKPQGSIAGDIVTTRIAIDDGAHCKGSIEIGHK